MVVRLILACAFLAAACGSIDEATTTNSAPAGDSTQSSTTVDSSDDDSSSGGELAAVEDTMTPPERSTTTSPAPTSEPESDDSTSASSLVLDQSQAGRTTSTFPTRSITNTGFVPFATAGDVVLHLPAERIELIGFHESGHDGSQQMTANIDLIDQGPQWMTMETRDRGTGDRTAADIAVDPTGEIRSPVTGTVLRAGGYILYCEHQDDFIVIEPDAQPGWEVKIFHISGVQVFSGARVEAGVTVIAPAPTRLPFESQIDELAAAPAWPHVHIEVVDPSIPDRPSGGGC